MIKKNEAKLKNKNKNKKTNKEEKRNNNNTKIKKLSYRPRSPRENVISSYIKSKYRLYGIYGPPRQIIPSTLLPPLVHEKVVAYGRWPVVFGKNQENKLKLN